jgi:ElaB/YqjD/DUF883 family membrane-anchored ribosome-binding protein
MPPRDQELPEGTDQIINGAMETGAGAGASTGSSADSGFGESGFGGIGGGGTTPGGSADFAGGTGTGGGFASTATGTGTTGSGGFIGSAGGTDDTGGLAGSGGAGTGSALSGSTSAGLSSTSGSGGGFGGGSDLGGGGGSGGGFGDGGFGGGSEGGGSGGGGVQQQLKSGVQNLQSQATDKVRAYAVDGKQRATTALDDLSQVVNEAAQNIDERLGPQYGEYARRAAGAVSGLADNLRNKDVDELFDQARDVVRKSPGVAIGVAAVLGFTLVRLVKAGIPEEQTDVEFQPDPSLGSGTGTSTAGTDTTGTTGSTAPYVAPTSTTGA